MHLRLFFVTTGILLAGTTAATPQEIPSTDSVTVETPACTPGNLQIVSLTEPRAVLARALRLYDKSDHSSEFLRRSVRTQTVCADSLAFLKRWESDALLIGGVVAPLPASVQVLTNSDYPRDRNNGAVWNGVGINSVVAAGAKAQWRFVSAAIQPTLIFQENRSFSLPVSPYHSEYAYPFTGQIDYPLRMGPESFTSFELGNAFIEARKGGFSAVLSNENLWMGPTQIHSLLMSNTAPAIPHFRIGTNRPVDLGIARGELVFIYGQAEESPYFDGDENNDKRLFQATLASIEFKGVPGLHLGFARALHDSTTATGHDVSFYLSRVFDNPLGGDAAFRQYNRLGVFYGRWALRESGFEAYMEWGREDFAIGAEGFLREPDYSQVWAAGFQKAFIAPGKVSRLYGEIVHLGQAAPLRGGRDVVQFYTHGSIIQGHTNRGQLLGAGVGIGSDAQTLGYEVFTSSSKTGLMLERARYDDDAYYRLLSRRFGESRHDVEITAEASRLQLIGPVTLEAVVRVSRRYDRHFVTALLDTESTIETNFGTEITGSWTPRW
jgi:hypothetical protein